MNKLCHFWTHYHNVFGVSRFNHIRTCESILFWITCRIGLYYTIEMRKLWLSCSNLYCVSCKCAQNCFIAQTTLPKNGNILKRIWSSPVFDLSINFLFVYVYWNVKLEINSSNCNCICVSLRFFYFKNIFKI